MAGEPRDVDLFGKDGKRHATVQITGLLPWPDILHFAGKYYSRNAAGCYGEATVMVAFKRKAEVV
jgi:hypothetical protein